VQFHGTPPPQASHTQATDQEKAADHPINWDRPIFWLVCAAAVGVHLSVFIPLLRMYPEFRPIWYVPIVIGEATFFGTTLDLVLGRTNKHGGPTR
jgi:hypothetical protein